MDIAILSNINLDLLIRNLSKKHNIYTPAGYGAWMQEISNLQSDLYKFNPGVIFIILDAEELFHGTKTSAAIDRELEEYITLIEQAMIMHPSISFFISSIDFPPDKIRCVKGTCNEWLIEGYWYRELGRLVENRMNSYIFDLKEIIEDSGRNEFYSAKLWFLAGMKFSLKALKLIEDSIGRLINAIEGRRRKCIVLDLDNTLWGGILGEVGDEGIELSEFKEGARYKDFQKRLKEIKNLGIILAIASKNNHEDAVSVISRHKDMVLRESDFVLMKINWNTKIQSIREIADELNIGLDSIIFIDDSRFERESVAVELPDVLVPEFPKDTSRLPDFINEIYRDYLMTLKLSEEDSAKTEMYSCNIKRQIALRSAASFEDFLKSLKTRLIIRKADVKDIQRVSQLTQKTNQFNLTTKRYTEAEIGVLIDSNDVDVYTASVEDRFGDNGMVGVIILIKTDTKTAEVDTFLLSCRVMGRYIEEQFIGYVEDVLAVSGFENLRACYVPTSRNRPVEDLYLRLGYILEDNSNNDFRRFRLGLPRGDLNSRKAYCEVIVN